MRLTDKTEQYSRGHKRYEGKYKGCKCDICYSADEHWYYYCSNNEDTIRHNSLWDKGKGKYESKDECHDACVNYIDEQLKNIRIES